MPWHRKSLLAILFYCLLRRRRRELTRLARLRRDPNRVLPDSSSDESSESSNEDSFEEQEIDDDFSDSNDAPSNEEGVEIKQELDPFDEEIAQQSTENQELQVDVSGDTSGSFTIEEDVLDNTEIKLEPLDIKEEIVDDENIENPLDIGADPASDCLEMTAEDFQILVEMIGPLVKKQNTHLRQAIPVKDRVAAALCYLETGGPFSHISSCLNISRQLICNIIPQVCGALVDALDNNMMMPNCQHDWKIISKKFETFKLPNCVGILVGRQIQKTGVGLILLIDAEYNILFAETIDSPSKEFNFDTSELYKKIISNEIHLPPAQPLPGQNNPMPYVFLADEGFPLTPNILRRFSNPEDELQGKFNEKLGVVDRIFENVLGFLSTRFQVWNKQMTLKIDTTKLVLKSTICLYNFLRRTETSKLINCPDGTFDCEIDGIISRGTWRDKKNSSEFLQSSYLPFSDCLLTMENAAQIRDEFVNFLNH